MQSHRDRHHQNQKTVFKWIRRIKPDTYILDWWQPKTTLMSGITKVFEAMKNDWV